MVEFVSMLQAERINKEKERKRRWVRGGGWKRGGGSERTGHTHSPVGIN